MLLRLVSVLGGWGGGGGGGGGVGVGGGGGGGGGVGCGWLVGENNLRKEKPEGARFKDET